MKVLIVLSALAVTLVTCAPTDSESKTVEKRDLFDDLEDLDRYDKVKTITKKVPVPYPVKVEKKVPVFIEKKVPVIITKKVPVDRPVPIPYKVPVTVPVVHKQIVKVPKPYPVPVAKPYPVYVKKPVYIAKPVDLTVRIKSKKH